MLSPEQQLFLSDGADGGEQDISEENMLCHTTPTLFQ